MSECGSEPQGVWNVGLGSSHHLKTGRDAGLWHAAQRAPRGHGSVPALRPAIRSAPEGEPRFSGDAASRWEAEFCGAVSKTPRGWMPSYVNQGRFLSGHALSQFVNISE